MNFTLEKLVRPNVARMRPYSSARSEFTGEAEVLLDANENAFFSPSGTGLNRYPDPLQKELKNRISPILGVPPEQIFVGNGSDEAIDLLFRVFCEPGRDECIICPPTYGMYSVLAELNDVAIKRVPLSRDFQLNVAGLLDVFSDKTKLLCICSPNNPTGNLLDRGDLCRSATEFPGIVVVDEAYIEFAKTRTMIDELARFPNLVVLRTFSKAWGMAGLRVGMAVAASPIIDLLNRVKPPYNISGLAQQIVLNALDHRNEINGLVEETLEERERLRSALMSLSFVCEVFPSDANFLLVKVNDATRIYRALIDDKIVVRDRSDVELCEGCLRITVGTRDENDRLLLALSGQAEHGRSDELLPFLFGGS